MRNLAALFAFEAFAPHTSKMTTKNHTFLSNKLRRRKNNLWVQEKLNESKYGTFLYLSYFTCLPNKILTSFFLSFSGKIFASFLIPSPKSLLWWVLLPLAGFDWKIFSCVRIFTEDFRLFLLRSTFDTDRKERKVFLLLRHFCGVTYEHFFSSRATVIFLISASYVQRKKRK